MSKIKISELDPHQSLIDLDIWESQYLDIIGGSDHITVFQIIYIEGNYEGDLTQYLELIPD